MDGWMDEHWWFSLRAHPSPPRPQFHPFFRSLVIWSFSDPHTHARTYARAYALSELLLDEPSDRAATFPGSTHPEGDDYSFGCLPHAASPAQV